MQIKKLLSNTAYWTINKELARDIGLDATIVLQHFIDLQSSFFEDGGFYQQQNRIVKDLPITIDYLRKAVKVLVDKGFLLVVKRGVPAKNHYTVLEENIIAYMSDTTSDIREVPLEVSGKDDKTTTRKTTNTKNRKSKNIDTNLDVPSDDDIKAKIFFKIVELYPKNRIGNRKDGLTKFKELDINQAKLALVNLKRYLNTLDQTRWCKVLQNYITQECWSEEYLKLEETKNKSRTITDVTNNADSFKNKNKGFYE